MTPTQCDCAHDEGCWRFWNHKALEQAAEIQRLRAALMAIGAWKHPGQTPHPLQRMAREALRGDERRDSDMIGQFGE